MEETLAFIGGGQMASALIGGLLSAGHAGKRVQVCEPDAGRRQALAQQYGVATHETAAAAVAAAQVVVLAVKPQVMAAAVRDLRLAPGTCVLSIAAGIRLASLRAWLGPQVWLVRSMPNTPALLGAGMSALYAEPDVPQQKRRAAEAVLAAVGQCLWVEEEAQIDAITAVSGSGPAYYFLLTEALREAGVALGLNADIADRLATRTLIGAARMAEGSGHDVVELRENVTSRGGTTEAALRVLEAGGLRELLCRATAAAEHRARELGDSLAKGQ